MHGHSYRLEVAVRGPVQTDGPARGMIVDFDDIERVVNERIVDRLDHQTLNDFIENPTAETSLPGSGSGSTGAAGLDELVLWETTDSRAVLRRSDFEP